MDKIEKAASAPGESTKTFAQRGSLCLYRYGKTVTFSCSKCNSSKTAMLIAFDIERPQEQICNGRNGRNGQTLPP